MSSNSENINNNDKTNITEKNDIVCRTDKWTIISNKHGDDGDDDGDNDCHDDGNDCHDDGNDCDDRLNGIDINKCGKCQNINDDTILIIKTLCDKIDQMNKHITDIEHLVKYQSSLLEQHHNTIINLSNLLIQNDPNHIRRILYNHIINPLIFKKQDTVEVPHL